MSNLFKILKYLHKLNCPVCGSRLKVRLRSIKNRTYYNCSCNSFKIQYFYRVNSNTRPGFTCNLIKNNLELIIDCYLSEIVDTKFEIEFISNNPYRLIYTLKYLPDNLFKLSSKEIIDYFNNLRPFI